MKHLKFISEVYLQSLDIQVEVTGNIATTRYVMVFKNRTNKIIDLYVKDPNGETCCYFHPQTEIGGRISYHTIHDYGPAQFMLKKAISGKYGVYVNFYGDSQVKATGPSTIMAEIYTRYADKTE